MAITLPYPDLVFVPLDKLTAEEMNEIVANYTAIASKAGELQFIDKADTTSTSVTSSDVSVVRTLDISSIPTGSKFLVEAQCTSFSGASAPFYYTNLRYNSVLGLQNPIQTTSAQVSTFIKSFTKSSGANSVEIIVGWADSAGVTVNNSYMSALVVG